MTDLDVLRGGIVTSLLELAPFSAAGEGMVCLLWPGRLDSE